MKEEVRDLWNLCFGDNEAFTDLYFSKRYNEEVNLSIQEKGKVISALQILPYPMTFCGEIIPTGYISGACTHPDYREKGAMKRLLLKSFHRMQENNVPLTTLIPAEEWLFDYYSKLGYVSVFENSEQIFSVKRLSPSSRYLISEFTSLQTDVYPFFDEKMKERPCCIQHTLEDFQVILDDLHLGKGNLFTARVKDKIVGLVFCYVEGDTLHVPELFFENKDVRNTLLFETANKMNAKRIICISPSIDETGEILGMARIINAEKMLQIYATQYPELELSFNLTDNLIEENNAFYSIKSGNIKKEGIKKTSLKISIQQLTQGLMGYKIEQLPKELSVLSNQSPYMSLMLD
ncbi:GNAT family N-acetyltransferase [uncultured Bacteroides sp.]|uniref:GNAT family N-acetyltransferase n=1 Tax=uncultured Bacteroides sp. TaxID=162156 RepID=UPI002AAC49F2|nr:GNAT family N-acetyltransferase [uncultured Bacteroides sp.]